ncbi:unnamed protein product [Leptosia nina]|uniref:Uncharacterized protein n=1 Tax=Leptosia nina TaxID=320188 RepID=A0AAV1J4Z6_9NEOP
MLGVVWGGEDKLQRFPKAGNRGREGWKQAFTAIEIRIDIINTSDVTNKNSLQNNNNNGLNRKRLKVHRAASSVQKLEQSSLKPLNMR